MIYNLQNRFTMEMRIMEFFEQQLQCLMKLKKQYILYIILVRQLFKNFIIIKTDYNWSQFRGWFGIINIYVTKI